MDVTYAPSFERFLDALREQIHKHGRPSCQAKDDPKSRAIGFTSPDGWFLIPIGPLKEWVAWQMKEREGLTRIGPKQLVQEALQTVWDAAPS